MRPVFVALPIADRQVSYRFYRDGLGWKADGEPAEDGVPEPLRFFLNEGMGIMLVPTGGFGWVIGGREVASRGHSECVLNLDAGSDERRRTDAARARGGCGARDRAWPAAVGLRRCVRRP